MVLIHIIAKDIDQARSASEVLIQEDLVLNVVTYKTVQVSRKNDQGQIETVDQVFLMAQTKALLFNTIDQRLRTLFGEDMPMLYSVPIVNMDWEQANYLVEHIARV